MSIAVIEDVITAETEPAALDTAPLHERLQAALDSRSPSATWQVCLDMQLLLPAYTEQADLAGTCYVRMILADHGEQAAQLALELSRGARREAEEHRAYAERETQHEIAQLKDLVAGLSRDLREVNAQREDLLDRLAAAEPGRQDEDDPDCGIEQPELGPGPRSDDGRQ